MKEQLSMFDSMTAKDQVTMLVDALDNMEEIDDINHKLEESYIAGNLAAIEELGMQSLQNTQDKKLRHFFETDLLIKRNITMTKRMQKRLKEGNTIIAVGALHLPGDRGILALLEKLGYFVFAEEE